ncbi:molecular chaperone DnaJ [Bacillus gaemokensis]|uniref:Molecular chaperone DnaJ n=1 Tax=Bacillus gaemokensis TaxID=574375 RepID=A0A073K4B0_9BACI|nr:molecular chaperone DnaJ [Bacillus gaemokensis]KEK22134.1 molecular chaperone DnaJ [Bacillus gaemokensis]KYG35571.1 molecular chaperone DnaJ [Bacillus gaemokensis]
MNFFHSVTTLEELKKQYKKLAKKHHPDLGGKHEDFIQLKKEYDKLFEKLNNTSENTGAYQNIIDEIIKYDLEIEIIGTWIWITGNTYKIKKELKELGFKWAAKKKAWYWYEGKYKKYHKKDFTLDEIRTMHKVKRIKKSKPKLES